ncbi:P-loop containing nucleoside triphosphate hydrolase protein [Chytridium lagenaria]|nr:P-loop containing nucleoside triphosphate hydrolase protein [Chytridium lagenaria]
MQPVVTPLALMDTVESPISEIMSSPSSFVEGTPLRPPATTTVKKRKPYFFETPLKPVIRKPPQQTQPEAPSTSSVKVFLRCRPNPPGKRYIAKMNDREVCFAQSTTSSVKSTDRDTLKQECFQFEHVFGEHIFRLAAAPLTNTSELLMAYGPSGSGKTFTLGINGILGFALQGLFGRLANAQTKLPVKCKGWDDVVLDEHGAASIPMMATDLASNPAVEEYALFMSFLEIYNDRCRDLLEKNPTTKNRRNYNPGSSDIEDVRVEDINAARSLISTAISNRSISGTKVNQESSRGHMITTIKLVKIRPYRGGSKRVS